MRPSLSVLLFTEDTGADAHATVATVSRKLLYLLQPRLDASRVNFPPESAAARAGMAFNTYKSRSPRDEHKKVDLARAIARHLLTDDLSTLVIVHIDADRRWSDREDEHGCDNLRCFRKEIVRRVAEILRDRQDRLDRLLFLLPFWSIESWLFSNCPEALRICEEFHPRYAAAVADFERWHVTPGAIDDIQQPKDRIAFGSKYNVRLATGLSARRLDELGLSFAHAVAAARWSGVTDILPAHP